ncbi:lipase [Streptomyces hygroscopicus]|uniref:esterase/lipase family protein n=1 Tax=Streptomyces hygroscopicus TaxID=1912 RepID=UPI00223EAA9F|nr:alpha/beta fold hydrolase [Streptomyces hygroscopicus]MCW7940609.1 lipase [Streptomyces hygroscopicus]
MRRKTFRTALVAAAAASGIFAASSGTAYAADGPLDVEYNFTAGFLNGLYRAGEAPPGANDWGCRPTAQHPNPVVLVHGTLENMNDIWRGASPLLANNGYCVFAFDHGGSSPTAPLQGVGHMADSAAVLAAFVDRVRAATGAAKVDIVGHSQGGGPVPRYYLKNFPGAVGKVDKLIGINPSNHGTTLDGLTELGRTLHLLEPVNGLLDDNYPAMVEQEIGSEFNRRLDAGGDTVAGVDYTVIVTKFDQVVTPYTNGYLTAGPGASVNNIQVQDTCGKDATDHMEASYDPITLTNVLNALDPAHPRTVQCQTVLALTGPVGRVD